MPQTTPRDAVLFRMTSDQFCKLPPSDSFKLELLNGEVVAMTRPSPAHQQFIAELISALNFWIKPRRLGKLYPDTLVTLTAAWTPAPDLAFLARENRKRVQNSRIKGAVDLAIEVLSPRTKNMDRKDKFRAYARYGIGWYWIVDRKARTLEELELVGRAYRNVIKVSFDEPFTPRVFPGLTMDLASLE